MTAYGEGYEAYEHGAFSTENPYASHTKEWEEWREGWEHAEEDMEASLDSYDYDDGEDYYYTSEEDEYHGSEMSDSEYEWPDLDID